MAWLVQKLIQYKTSNVGMGGVFPEARDWNIALRTQILI